MGQAKKKQGQDRRKNTIGDFYPDLVSLEVMRAAVKSHGIELAGVDDESTPEQVALALTLHFREGTSADDMCKCESCEGEAPDSFERCPFCGLEGEAGDDEIEVVAEARSVTVEKQVVGEPAPVEPIAPSELFGPKGAKAAKAKKSGSGAASAGDENMKETTDMKAAMVVIDGGQKLVKVKGKGASTALTTEKDLDAAVARTLKFKIEGAKAYYQQAKEILEINTKGLWKLRTDDAGKVRYSGFDAFCHHELNMSPTNAFNMMAVAREWSPDDIEAIGRSKAVIILKAAPEDRKPLAEAAKAGASYREVQAGVDKSRKERGYAGDTPAAKRGSKGAKVRAENIKTKAAKKEPPAQDKITIAKIEGLKTIKLYAKPASLKNLNLDECTRAHRIADQPFGRLELANGVVMYVSLVEKDGFLSLKTDTRRESPVG